MTFPGLHMVELKNIRPVGKTQGDEGGSSGVRVYYGLTSEPTAVHKFRVERTPKHWEQPSLFGVGKQEEVSLRF